MSSGAQSLKIVFAGDSSVGKTCLLSAFKTGTFPDKYVRTVVDNHMHDISVDQRSISVRLFLWDTAGLEDYDKLRPLSYNGVDVFVTCFSVDNRSSYLNVRNKWQPELQHYAPNTPVVLVGTKTDLREDQVTIEHLKKQNALIISPEEGQALADQIGATKYIECSALRGQGLKEVFEEATRAHFGPPDGKKKKKKKNAACCACSC